MEYVLYTFESSSEAMRSEMALESFKIKARLVPLLPEIDAGCGLALRFEKKYYKEVEEIFKKENLNFSQRYILVYEEGHRKAKVCVYDLF